MGGGDRGLGLGGGKDVYNIVAWLGKGGLSWDLSVMGAVLLFVVLSGARERLARGGGRTVEKGLMYRVFGLDSCERWNFYMFV